MAFNIRNFRSEFRTFSQPNHFDMMFVGQLPLGMRDYAICEYFSTTGMRHRAFSTQLPGRTLDVVERRYSGPTRLIPTGYVYQALPISIYENSAGNVKYFFDKWMSLIAEQDYWFTKYYDDIIIEDLRLQLYSKLSKKDSAGGAVPTKTYILKEVFPISVNAVQLDWNTTNAVTIINVELQYYKWQLADTIAYDDSFDDFEGKKNSINKTPTNNKSNKKSKPLLPAIPEQKQFDINRDIINRDPFSTV